MVEVLTGGGGGGQLQNICTDTQPAVVDILTPVERSEVSGGGTECTELINHENTENAFDT